MTSVTSPEAASPAPFVIRQSAVAGRGAFATRRIAKGERIAEYTGEIITHAEADRRYDDESMEVHYTYLFTINSKKLVDATREGGDARYINHSCAPNCEANVEKGRVWIDAIADIEEGAELYYDYAYERDGTETEEDEQRYVCRCGAPSCRGSIMEPMATFQARERQKQARQRQARRKSTGEATRAQRQRQRA